MAREEGDENVESLLTVFDGGLEVGADGAIVLGTLHVRKQLLILLSVLPAFEGRSSRSGLRVHHWLLAEFDSSLQGARSWGSALSL